MSNLDQVARVYLAKLARGGVVVSKDVLSVEHVTASHIAREIPTYETEDLQAFVTQVAKEFSKIPPLASDPGTERIEIEESKVILLALPRLARCFNGFLKEKPIFGFDPRLAAEFTTEEADKIQKRLLALGFETQARPVIQRSEEAF